MSTQYDFKTSTFAINKKELHLLKNNDTYKIYKSDSISEISVFYGKELRNWIIGVVVGSSMTAFGLYFTWILIQQLFMYTGALTPDSYIIAFPPLLMGGFLLYISFRKSMIAAFKTPSKLVYLSLRDIVRAGQIDDFYRFLKKHFKSKIVRMPA